MQLTGAELQEFVTIWKEEFQESISLDEARHAASLLMELYALLLEPLPTASTQVLESLFNDYRT